jgi:hypothetical protein
VNNNGEVDESEIADGLTSSTDAQVLSAVNLKHTQGKDQGLDTGGANAVTAAQAKSAYTASHTQGTDQGLDTGGANPVLASDLGYAKVMDQSVSIASGVIFAEIALKHTAPILYINNSTVSNALAARSAVLTVQGYKVDSTLVEQGNITFQHDTALNDTKSRMVININNGTSPVEALRIDSNLDMTLAEEMILHDDKYITLGDDSGASKIGYKSGVGYEHSIIEVPEEHAFWIGQSTDWSVYIGVFNVMGSKGVELAASEDAVNFNSVGMLALITTFNTYYVDADFEIRKLTAGSFMTCNAGADSVVFASTLMGFFGHGGVVRQTKATHNNWAALSDLVSALVNLGFFDTI